MSPQDKIQRAGLYVLLHTFLKEALHIWDTTVKCYSLSDKESTLKHKHFDAWISNLKLPNLLEPAKQYNNEAKKQHYLNKVIWKTFLPPNIFSLQREHFSQKNIFAREGISVL